jgi:hypothetical protein
MDDIEEKIKNFHKTIDNWISEHKIDYGSKVNEDQFKETCRIMNFTKDDLKSISAIDAQIAIYNLNQYLHYLHTVVDREKAVKAWVDQTIGYIVSGSKLDKYMKWEEKYHMAIRNHSSGLKLQILKTTAEARILSGGSSISTTQNAIKALENIGRSRSYDRS